MRNYYEPVLSLEATLKQLKQLSREYPINKPAVIHIILQVRQVAQNIPYDRQTGEIQLLIDSVLRELVEAEAEVMLRSRRSGSLDACRCISQLLSKAKKIIPNPRALSGYIGCEYI